jgi:outer membrane receptor protein involved in Fe transport
MHREWNPARLSVVVGLAGAANLHSSPTFAQSNAETLTLEEITVTAEKRSENLQDVPATISVIGSYGAPGQTTLTIRGISPLSANATVGSYIDDTPIGSTGFHNRGGNDALDLLPFDVRQIEVLSGPQGTLYGANAPGGLIKYDLTVPNLDKRELRVGGSFFDVSNGTGTGGLDVSRRCGPASCRQAL